MTSLLRTEWLKMRKYKAFWWIMGITTLSYLGLNAITLRIYNSLIGNSTEYGQYAKMAIGNPFAFPETWHTVAFFFSLLVFIPAVVIIMFISNEYTFRTHRQNIIDGWSRRQFVTSKLLDVLIISLLITILYAIVAFITGVNNQERLIKHTWDQAYYIGLFGLQTFAQLSIAFFLGFIIKKAFLALGVFLFYFIVLENIIVGFLQWKSIPGYAYFPLEISDRMIPRPGFMSKFDTEAYANAIAAIPTHVILTIILTTLIWLLCYRINNRRDLK